MKAVILAGGMGTRIGGGGHHSPKPMIEIGGRPILWHIMKEYAHHGIDEFIICAGYRQRVIREYFAGLLAEDPVVTFDFREENSFTVSPRPLEPWKVTIVDTGQETMTGGRILRVRELIGDETFLLTYGDGVSDVDIGETIEAHRRSGKLATVTAVQPAERFGVLEISSDGAVDRFCEKTPEGRGWVNGGYMVLEPKVFDYIEGDETVFEREPMEKLAAEGQLQAFRHDGFWQCMDTAMERKILEDLIITGDAPWVTWED